MTEEPLGRLMQLAIPLFILTLVLSGCTKTEEPSAEGPSEESPQQKAARQQEEYERFIDERVEQIERAASLAEAEREAEEFRLVQREVCEELRGREYESDAERAFFLSTCVATAVPGPQSARPILPAATVPPPPPAGCPRGCISPPPGCSIKGNISFETGERIYHVPGGEFYAATVISTSQGERWFCTTQEAVANGWRASQR